MLLALLSFKEPSGYPSEVQITSQTFTMVTFQWKELECYEENGPITGYQYRICYDNSNYSEGRVDAKTNRITLFKRNVQFFSVAAINLVGIGPHCPPLLVPNFDEGGANF